MVKDSQGHTNPHNEVLQLLVSVIIMNVSTAGSSAGPWPIFQSPDPLHTL
jgi:hypothetical protein